MGLIRKSLAVGTIGLVNPSSKKQRVARATMKNTAAAAAALEKQVALQQQQAAQEHAFRYHSDPVYRAWVDQQAAAAAEAARIEHERRAARRRLIRVRAAQVVVLPAWLVLLSLVAVLIWMPQMAMAKARRQRFAAWRKPELLGNTQRFVRLR